MNPTGAVFQTHKNNTSSITEPSLFHPAVWTVDKDYPAGQGLQKIARWATQAISEIAFGEFDLQTYLKQKINHEL